MGSNEIGHLIVGEPGELGGGRRRSEFLDRRHGEHQHLHVIVKPLDLSPPRVKVGQRIVEMKDPLSVVTKLRAWNAFEVPLDLLQVAPWKDMRERIDHAHRRPLHPHASPNRTGGLVGQVMAGTLGSSSIAASIRDCDSSMSSSLPAKYASYADMSKWPCPDSPNRSVRFAPASR